MGQSVVNMHVVLLLTSLLFLATDGNEMVYVTKLSCGQGNSHLHDLHKSQIFCQFAGLKRLECTTTPGETNSELTYCV